MVTYCSNMIYKRTQEAYDEVLKMYRITCIKTGEICKSQRYCGEKNKYIISEQANSYCSNYKTL